MNRDTCDLLIHNGQVITMDSERKIYRPGAVAITGSRIVEIGTDADLTQRFDATETMDAGGGIVHPGFIDAHNHIVHTSCRGVFGNIHDTGASPINFADWKAGVTDEDEAAATAMAGLEMLRCGFTMFIEPGSLFSTEAGAEAVERVGLRALLAPLYLWDRRECFDAMPALESSSLMARAPIDLARSLGQLDGELHRNKDPDALVRGYVFVYGVGTGSPELLQAAHACARDHNVPLHLHAGYVPEEAEIYRGMTGTSQLAHLHELGRPRRAHGYRPCECSGSRRKKPRFKSRAARLSGARAPSFRWELDDGRASRWRSGIGEACASRWAPTARSTAHQATPCWRRTSRHRPTRIPCRQGRCWKCRPSTRPRPAGLDAELGSLEPGKRADVVVRSARAAEAYPANNPLHLLALTMGSGSVDTVLVNGKVVFSGGHSNPRGRGQGLPGRLRISGCASEAAGYRSEARVADRQLRSASGLQRIGQASGLVLVRPADSSGFRREYACTAAGDTVSA